MRWMVVVAAASWSAPALAQDAGYDPYSDLIISSDISALPKPVQATRKRLVEASKSGDLAELAKFIKAQKTPVQVSFGDPEDPIAYLKTQSADGEGLQTLAILGEALDAPYAILGAHGEAPSYVWPYLAVVDVTQLTKPQLVDAYRLLPAEEAKELTDMGSWFSWRIYVEPNGDLSAFIAGD